MLSSKNKTELKKYAQAHSKEVLKINIGKDLIDKTLIESINNAFRTRELLKISLLKSSMVQESKNEILIELVSNLKCEVVQIIGNTVLLYKENTKLPHRIILSK